MLNQLPQRFSHGEIPDILSWLELGGIRIQCVVLELFARDLPLARFISGGKEIESIDGLKPMQRLGQKENHRLAERWIHSKIERKHVGVVGFFRLNRCWKGALSF